jgi:hypothetical protein
MKTSLRAILAIAALAWPLTAFAITQTSTITVTETGKPIPTATVTITVKETPKATPKVKRPPTRTVDRTTVKSDPKGRISLTYDDDKWRKDMLVDISITTADGRRLTRTNVPFSSLIDGSAVDVPPAAVPTRVAKGGPKKGKPKFRIAEDQPPVPRDRVFVNGGGFFVSGSVVPNSGSLTIIETLTATGQQTNKFDHQNGGTGGGFAFGYVPANAGGPNGDGLILTPFMSFDFPNNRVEQRFSPVSFIGERVIFVGTAGLQFGRMITPDIQLYGLIGPSVVHKKFTIDFGGPVKSSDSQWLFGGTIGIGGNYQPPGWTFMGRPVTLFAQYQHVFVQDGEMNRPAVSPAFNYRFENDLDIFKFGVNVPLGAAPLAR